MLRTLAVAVGLLLASVPASAATQGGAIPVPLPLFPMNNWWNVDITQAPTELTGASMISTSLNGANPLTLGLHPDFGGDSGDPDFPIYGIPYIIVEGSQTKLTVEFDVPEESDGVNHPAEVSFPFYPIPSEAISMTGWVEGGQPGNVDQRADADRHILIVDKTNNHLYELYNVWYNGTGWQAFSGAFFNMNTNNRRPETWTSGDAAGLAILPGLVRYDEFSAPGEFQHAFRVTVQRTADAYVFPASHEAGSTLGALPMGARLRLKAGIDISGHPASVQKIFRAFKKYGLIVADNGSNMYVSGNYDVNWDNDILNPAFSALKANDFEVIQLGWHPAVTFVLTLPATTGSDDVLSATLTAYNQNYTVATGYTGTVQFMSTDGAATLPANYTFTPGDAGTHTFSAPGFIMHTVGSQTVTVTDTLVLSNTLTRNILVGPPTPTGLVAAATTTTSIDLSWGASTGATQYQIERSSSPSGFTALGSTNATAFTDNTVAAGATYVYKVKATDSAMRPSSFSVPDAATTILFTNDPLVATVTGVKAAHVSELRQAANAMRATAGLTASSFTDPVLNSTVTIKAVHLQELRTAMNQARAALAVGTLTYTDPTLPPTTTVVKALHVQELRNGAK